MAAEYTQDDFETEVLNADQTVLVDFYSDTWAPCKRLGPVIDELATDNEGGAKVGKVNVGNHMDLAIKYNIMAVPTILVFKGGEVVGRTQGYKEKDELQTMIDSA